MALIAASCLAILALPPTVAAETGRRCGTPSRPLPRVVPDVGDCTNSLTNPSDDYMATTLLEIPVVVHIIENSMGDGAVSDELVASQIEILNEDFMALAGTPGAPGAYAAIQFSLAVVDPDGSATTGITRSVNDEWFLDGGQYWETLAWDTSRYLNLYTNNADENLGYVPGFPQDGIVGTAMDRVVVAWDSFGRDSVAGPPYDQGRTATHELGHYLGLYHTFEGGCSAETEPGCHSGGDTICDTPSQEEANSGCLEDDGSGPASCGSTDPIHNYMDYSDDTCMFEFTEEQVRRMRCSLVNYRPALGVIIESALCGNDIAEIGEDCDGTSDQACPAQCTGECQCPAVPPLCGDGVLDSTEECDDGNTTGGDGCASDCTVEPALTAEAIKCIVAMNKAAAKLAKTTGKEQAWCVKSASKGKVASAAACIAADMRAKLARARNKVVSTQASKCTPEFLAGDDWAAEIIETTAETGTSSLAAVFGLDLDASLAMRDQDKGLAACQYHLLKGYTKLANAQLKVFNKCKKKGFRSGLIASQAALTACLGIVATDAKVVKAAAKMQAAATDRCETATLATGFPGSCASAADTAGLGDCALASAGCHVCYLLEDIDELSADCELFDDGEHNSSCPPRPAELHFQQSMLQAFYFVTAAGIDGEELTELDWIGAFRGDVCVGARAWAGPWTDVPAMGDDGYGFTAGYMLAGEQPSFKIYDASRGEILEATPSSNCAFQNLLFCYLDSVSAVSGD